MRPQVPTTAAARRHRIAERLPSRRAPRRLASARARTQVWPEWPARLSRAQDDEVTELVMPSSASNIRSAWFTTVRVSWRRSRAAQHADLSAHAGAQLSPLADRPTAAWGARRRAASRRHPNLHRQYAAPRTLPRACVAAPAAPGLPKSCLSWEPCCHLNRHRTSQTAVARYAHVTRVDAARYAHATRACTKRAT